MELSQPKEGESSDRALKEVRGRGERGQDSNQVSSASIHDPVMRKPWEDIIKERLKTKTKIISKVDDECTTISIPIANASCFSLSFDSVWYALCCEASSSCHGSKMTNLEASLPSNAVFLGGNLFMNNVHQTLVDRTNQ